MSSIPFKSWLSIDARVRGKSKTMMARTVRGKIKLHGTNAAIRFAPDGSWTAQSRNRILTADYDNAGFYAWVDANVSNGNLNVLKYLAGCAQKIITVYGEWCGSNIQTNVALTGLPNFLAVFAFDYEGDLTIFEPSWINRLVGQIPDVYILPWHTESLVVDPFGGDATQAAIDAMNKYVYAIEEVDPWVEENFGVRGPGEGLVFYEIPKVGNCAWKFSEIPLKLFKAKGEDFRTVKSRNPVQMRVSHATGVQDFVEMVVTPARLRQGVQEGASGELDIRQTGPFLKWIANDIIKECGPEMEESGLVWKDVAQVINSRAMQFWREQIQAD